MGYSALTVYYHSDELAADWPNGPELLELADWSVRVKGSAPDRIQVELPEITDGQLETLIEYFADFLCREEFLLRCKSCKQFIDFRKGKKYCSALTEGRACGKSVNDKQYYRQHPKKRR